MVVNKRLEQERLARVLQGRKSSIEVQALVQLLEVLIDRVKVELVGAALERVPALQGEAQAYQKLTKLIHREDISPTEKVSL